MLVVCISVSYINIIDGFV